MVVAMIAIRPSRVVTTFSDPLGSTLLIIRKKAPQNRLPSPLMTGK